LSNPSTTGTWNISAFEIIRFPVACRVGLVPPVIINAREPANLATYDHPLRFSSGGMLYVIEDMDGDQYLMTVARDDPARLSAMAGYASNFREVLDPRFVIAREGIEEAVMIIGPNVMNPLRPPFEKLDITILNSLISQGLNLGKQVRGVEGYRTREKIPKGEPLKSRPSQGLVIPFNIDRVYV